MINSGRYINYIIAKLNMIRHELLSKNKLNLTDDNIVLENFYCDILNLTYGYKLINLNSTDKNYPGIDLGDESIGLGIQVTSDKSGKKVKETLNICIKNECYKKYKNLNIFILSEKQKTYSVSNESNLLNFNIEKDVFDLDDLYRDILYISTDKRREICTYINLEIDDVMKSLNADCYDEYDFKRIVKDIIQKDWLYNENENIYMLTINHCFGYIPFHIDVLIDGSPIVVDEKRSESKIELIANSKFDCKVMIS